MPDIKYFDPDADALPNTQVQNAAHLWTRWWRPIVGRILPAACAA